jgi:archaeosortase A (PGF-CTERM-specific)
MLLLIASIITLFLGKLTSRRTVSAVGWLIIAVYGITKLPYYITVEKSFIKAILVGFSVPLSTYVSKLAYEEKELPTKLASIVIVAGGITFSTGYPVVEKLLIETVTSNTVSVVESLGESADISTGANGYQSRISLAGNSLATYITLACTGVGATSIFAGLFAAVDASKMRRLSGFLATAILIYILNILRNVFVALSYGKQWFDYNWVMQIVGYESVEMTSFFISHNVISQSLAVVASLGLIFVSMKIVPEVEDLLVELVEFLPV